MIKFSKGFKNFKVFIKFQNFKTCIWIIILKNDKTIIAYLENYLCNSQNIEANML
jgi:hypothetical protein